MPASTLPAIGYTATLANLDNFLAALGAMSTGAEQVGTGLDWVAVKSYAAGQALYNFAAQGVQKLLSLAEAGIMGAARVGELNRVLYTLGAQNGLTQQAVDQNVASIKALGIETDNAQSAVMQFIRYNIQSADATKLARTAQDAAVIGMINSSDALTRMLHGITTGQTEVLRGIGLNVSFEQSYAKIAEQLHKNVAALSETERVQARVNAVLESGASIAGSYATAMESPAKRLRSLERVWNEISLAIGQHAQPAFGAYVGIMENLAKSIQAAVSEGGKLYPILQTLGALAAIAGEQLGGFAKTLTTTGINALAAFGNEVGRVAEDALTWGFNIMAQFAGGIAEGAATVLVAAMNTISDILSFFLSPGSPPRVAPDLDKWGIAAMTAWLEGFTEADYGILDSIGGSLQNVFGALAGVGIMDKEGIPALMLELTRGFTEAIETGSDTTAMLARIGALTGAYGSEVTQLVTQQLALAQATAAVTAAQKAYTDAQKAEAAAQTKVGTLTAEYNKLLRSGASKDALKTKLAEVRAAEAAAKAARSERVAAGEAITAAGEKADVLQKEVSLQAKLVQQLNAMFKLQAEAQPAARTAGEIAKKAGAAIPKAAAIKPFVQPDIKLDTSILDKLKADLAAKLKGIFAPLVAEWDKTILPKLTEVWQAFDRLRIVAGEVFTKIMTFLGSGDAQKGIRLLGQIIGGLLAVRLVWAVIGPAIGVIITILGAIINAGLLLPVLAIIAVVALLATAWTQNWGDIQGKTAAVIAWLTQAFADVRTWFETNLPKALAVVQTKWGEFTGILQAFWRVLQDVWQVATDVASLFGTALHFALTLVGGYLKNTLLPGLNDIRAHIITFFKPAWDAVLKVFQDIWNFMVVTFTPAWTIFQAALAVVWAWIVTTFQPAWDAILKVFQDISTTISQSVQTALQTLHDFLKDTFIAKIIEYVADNGPLKALERGFGWIAEKVEAFHRWLLEVRDALNAIAPPWWATPHSPPPLAQGFGFISDAVKELANIALPQLRTSLRVDTADLRRVQDLAVQLAPARVSGGVVNQRPTNITFQTTINSAMDAYAFENRVRRVLNRELAA